MTHVEILDAARDRAGYKVDVSRGERIGRVSVHRQGPDLQPALPANVRALSGGADGLHPGLRLGERTG
jgi:hypothetical protein